jgi:glycosyltransferase involved in cell wall biosynthesis
MTRSPDSLRLGLADSLDPTDIQGGSGATGSLLRALDGLIAEVVPINGELPAPLGRAAHLASVAARIRPRDLGSLRHSARRSHAAAKLGRPTIAARWLLARARLARAGPLDGIIQRGSEMRLPDRYTIVSYEDSTVVQARRSYPWAHLQGLDDRDLDRYVRRQKAIYDSAVACCCATHWVADSVIGDYGIPPERVFVVGLGQNHAAGEPAPRDWSTPRYLFVGVDWERKNGPAVLGAFAAVRERIPAAQLDVVGGHPRIEQAGVVPHGPLSLARSADRERMAELYRRATAFVMPSLHEPAGIVYVEAAGAGVPSIGTTDGGAATMIGPGGVVVDPRDPEALLGAMLELADPETARRLGELAYRHSTLFTWERIAERLIRAMAIPGLDTGGLAEFL